MYKVMIVDDEIGVRNSLKAKIDWGELGFHVIAEAANGKEALEMLEHTSIDVVITDIQMSVMNGVQFFKVCTSKCFNIKLVVLSGYSYFEYTKAAIKAGVRDYLIKPVKRKELAELLSKLKDELDQDKHQQIQINREKLQLNQLLADQREHLLHQLVKNEWTSTRIIHDRLIQLKMTELTRFQYFIFVTVEMKIPEMRAKNNSSRMDLFNLSFLMLCKEIISGKPDIYCFQDFSASNMIYFILMSDTKDALLDQAHLYVKELHGEVKRILKLDMNAGVGKIVESVEGFKNGYVSSLLDWSIKMNGSPIGADSAELTEDLSSDLERRMVLELEKGDQHCFQLLLEGLLFPGKKLSYINFSFLALRIVMTIRSLGAKYNLDQEKLQQFSLLFQFSIWQFSTQEKVFEQIIIFANDVMQKIQSKKNTSGDKIIELVCKYIQDNYAYGLSLNMLAKQFHFNEAYISHLFKLHAKMNFSDYLVEVRMKKTGELIRDTSLKLTDIAQLVGYASSSYFSTAFKKFFHMTPSEYREQKQ